MMTLDRTRPGVAAMAVGIARAAFEFGLVIARETLLPRHVEALAGAAA
jgi:acyl-CoA dehydrogenase